ncbi:transcriptional regulator BetI [Leisingera daeponensis]|uniref:HTH-type transcriptional regulator BetI n=1 Tax=Leisingera daeponensis TaxID=405746 RepID=A0ABS7NJH4_9RHOB|nr:transcriptional regulator BetI [Leisingera daeponensis]MBY6141071.1 transcriptional regulator BetI [Leisingera daeponensis]
MPKVGMRKVREDALIAAVINVIHEKSFDGTTLRAIAKEAGISPGLAHHYFPSKEKLLEAAIRSLLELLRTEVVAATKGIQDPDERLRALISANFSEKVVQPKVVSAWLVFYVQARKYEGTNRLIRLYHRRLASNFTYICRAWTSDRKLAKRQGEAVAALIDGLWLRYGLNNQPILTENVAGEVEYFVRAMLNR